MLRSTGTFATENGAKYMQQLAKHFAHKVQVELTETTAVCAMGAGPAEMRADAGGLTVTVTAPDAETMPKARDVIDRHLATFAFREGFTTLDWQEPVAA